MPSRFGVATNHEYNLKHKRDCITVWSGAYCLDFEAWGLSLPSGGYMLTTFTGKKIRVKCSSPRTEENYLKVDSAVSAAMEKWYRSNNKGYCSEG